MSAHAPGEEQENKTASANDPALNVVLWTPEVLASENKRKKRRYCKIEGEKVAANRGNACEEHRRRKVKVCLQHSMIVFTVPDKIKCDPDTCPRNRQNSVTHEATPAEGSKSATETSTAPSTSSPTPFFSPDREYSAPDVQRHENESFSTHPPFIETPVSPHEATSKATAVNEDFDTPLLPELPGLTPLANIRPQESGFLDQYPDYPDLEADPLGVDNLILQNDFLGREEYDSLDFTTTLYFPVFDYGSIGSEGEGLEELEFDSPFLSSAEMRPASTSAEPATTPNSNTGKIAPKEFVWHRRLSSWSGFFPLAWERVRSATRELSSSKTLEQIKRSENKSQVSVTHDGGNDATVIEENNQGKEVEELTSALAETRIGD
jgi:hypothetical protein